MGLLSWAVGAPLHARGVANRKAARGSVHATDRASPLRRSLHQRSPAASLSSIQVVIIVFVDGLLGARHHSAVLSREALSLAGVLAEQGVGGVADLVQERAGVVDPLADGIELVSLRTAMVALLVEVQVRRIGVVLTLYIDLVTFKRAFPRLGLALANGDAGDAGVLLHQFRIHPGLLLHVTNFSDLEIATSLHILCPLLLIVLKLYFKCYKIKW